MASDALVGKVIKEVFIDESREALKFVLDDGSSVHANTDADCCSSTWIEDVYNPEALTDAVVTSVENLDLPEELCQPTKTGNYEEEMAYYGCAITTDKGTCVVAYRNSSNGYYGGSLVWPGDYGCYSIDTLDGMNWLPLKEN